MDNLVRCSDSSCMFLKKKKEHLYGRVFVCLLVFCLQEDGDNSTKIGSLLNSLFVVRRTGR